MAKVTTSSISRPRSMRLMLVRLLRNRPADTRSVVDRAIWAVTRAVRKRAAARDPEGCPVWPLSVEARSRRVLSSAGKRPNRMPVPSARKPATATTPKSREKAIEALASGGSRVAMKRSVQRATARPATPAKAASSTDSVSSWPISLRRPAPIASRTAISPTRAAERASIKLATLAQAISSTTPATPRSRISGALASLCIVLWPRKPSSRVISRARKRAMVGSLRPSWSGPSTSRIIAP